MVKTSIPNPEGLHYSLQMDKNFNKKKVVFGVLKKGIGIVLLVMILQFVLVFVL
jgi:hypothetical protein